MLSTQESTPLIDPSLEAIRSIAMGRLDGEDGTIPVEDPATQQIIATVPNHTTVNALEAVTLADSAGREWGKTTPRHRSDILHAAYAHLIDSKDRLAALISREMGKPLAEAHGEVQYASDYVRWFAEEILRGSGGYRESPSGGSTIITTQGPVGLSVLITPWNFPLAMATRKIAPALAAGCGVVIKPATLTPLTTYLVVQLLEEAGVPQGLVQVVTTRNSSAFSEAVLTDPRVRKLSFTGSTPVGSTLMELAAKNIIKSSMELGGNAPLLVFDDADLERAAEQAMLAKMRNNGQTCVAANRILVQNGIADAFVEALTEKTRALRLGNPLDEATTLGPVIDHRAVERLSQLVNDAIAKGATLRTGGSVPDAPGYFFEATVLDDIPINADITSTEIFGPVAAISRFSTEEEAIRLANDTPFGLAGYVFTENADRAFNVAESLETGMVGINQGMISNVAAPFGGVKQSGLGREGSSEGLEEYQETKYFNLARRSSS
ncbi:NAD-dependent succinate-semialdehyde dehydrogenase [Citricoccus sp. NPDC055426]|uniref:NAD-dependent succinate-semialdehyde dehydrogenase n=1 Tax=Citricoccus sp. NPDC055426 TaxID=3155536 RepID=UPI00342A73B4